MMVALVRYTFATMFHGQRYLAPVLLFLGALAVISRNDNGPLPPVYALCAGALFICATWLTMALISVEDPTHRAVTVVAAGRSIRVLLAAVAVALVSCLALTGAGLVLPLLLGTHTVEPADLGVGLEAHLVCACAGIAIGLLCSRLVIRRQGYAFVLALGLVMIMLLVRGLPVNTLFNLMADTPTAAAVTTRAGTLLAVAAALLAVSTAATHHIAVRRD
jgi:hypothetical protein